jgi:Xaa-Pro aminopeptidase
MKRDYTLVLKGTMVCRGRAFRAARSAPCSTPGAAPLWAEGMDFGHGTGHGVGYFLNVHEGPQSISKAVPEPTWRWSPA